MSICLPARRASEPAWLRDPLWARARMVPSLDLRFAETQNLRDWVSGRDLVTFTRAGDGTFVDSQGVVRTAPTNLLTWSEDASQWLTPVNITLTTNQTTAPDGTSTADRYLETTTTGLHAQEGTTFTFVTSAVYTYSVFVKSINGRNYEIGFPPTVFASRFARFDLSAGTVQGTDAGVTATITRLADGWFRCAATSTCASGASSRVGNFINNGTARSYAGDTGSGLFIWGAMLNVGSTAAEYIPTGATINGAPRFTFDAAGRCQGLLVEEARTNSIRNNTMVGAVAGTPGTLPTGWNIAGLGTLSQQVVGTGVENGVSYIELRFSGTTSTSGLFIRQTAAADTAAANAQSWAYSAFTSLVAGSLSNVASVTATANLYNSSSVFIGVLTFLGYSASTSPILSRREGAGTIATASTAFIQPQIAINFSSGVAIDLTLRIGLPQLELGATVSSVVGTTSAAANRQSDLATLLSGLDLNTIRGMYAEFINPASGVRGIASLNDNTANERIGLSTSGTDPLLTVVDGGVAQASIDAGTFAANGITRLAARFGPNDFAVSVNGGAEVVDTSGTMPTVDRLMIGRTQASEYLNGPLARLVLFDRPPMLLQDLTR